MNRRHQQSMARATASLMDLITQAQTLQSGVMRHASDAEISRIRNIAYTYLGAYLDHMSTAGVAIREHVANDTRPEGEATQRRLEA